MDRKGAKTGFVFFFVLFGVVCVGRGPKPGKLRGVECCKEAGWWWGVDAKFRVGRGPNPALLVLDASRAEAN